VQLILAKHRNGPTGDLSLMFDRRTRLFTSREEAAEGAEVDRAAFSGC
jgi:hypothetical protein